MKKLLFSFRIADAMLIFLLMFLGISNIAFAKEPTAIRRTVAGMEYELLIPGDYNKETAYSLIIAMHGSDGKIEWVSDYWFTAIAAKNGFFVACPQLPSKFLYDDIFKKIDSIVKDIARYYHIDRRNLYITGFSMGGEIAIYYAITRPKNVKAVAMVSGRIRENVLKSSYYNKSNIKKLDVLVLCGKNDDTNKYYKKVVNYLKKYKAKVTSQIIEGGHDYEMDHVLKTLEYFKDIKSKN